MERCQVAVVEPLCDCLALFCLPVKHNETAVHIREDMKNAALLPLLKPKPHHTHRQQDSRRKLFGAPLQGEDVPQVFITMVEFLTQHGLQQEGLFRVSGGVRAAERLRQRMDDGQPVDLTREADACTVASLVKQFLRELPGGLIPSNMQSHLLQLHHDCMEEQLSYSLREHLRQLPTCHYNLLRYLCCFLTQVEKHQQLNRMGAANLATVFGPNVFHVSAGFDGVREQGVCNSLMAVLIQRYNDIFEDKTAEEPPNIITVKEAPESRTPTEILSDTTETASSPVPTPRRKAVDGQEENQTTEPDKESPTLSPRKKKVKKVKSETAQRLFPQPGQSDSLPQVRSSSSCRTRLEDMDLFTDDVTTSSSSPQDQECPLSPFYISSPLITDKCEAESADVLERTVRLAVEQHLFDGLLFGGQSSEECESPPAVTARQRRRLQRGHDELPQRLKDVDKEIVPAAASSRREDVERRSVLHRQHTHSEPRENTSSVNGCLLSPSHAQVSTGPDNMQQTHARGCKKQVEAGLSSQQKMKIQECQNGETGPVRTPRGPETDGRQDVPSLDLTGLTEDSPWEDPPFFTFPFLDFKNMGRLSYYEEPVPAYCSWQRECMDREEARLSPHGGGRLIRQLLEEDSDPMLSPRFHTYGRCPQYLEDTEVPPSPPNAHSFVSRRRSSSLGSCEDDREELTIAQISKKIHGLRRKIHKYEEKFEEERKYRPSHSDKAANTEVLRWMNELSKLRKDLKEHQLLKSEEDLPPLPRQRSNTLPKSFGSQLEKKAQEKTQRPPVESTLENVQKKLQEKRQEEERPFDIKDMTREQIAAEKVDLQKALLHYESIHGRPVTKEERQIMKPLYDRYRLVKQILCRASTIPVIGSPSSKRRGPQLQPIIEGVPALFFDKAQEEEDGSDDDADTKTPLAVTIKPEISMLSLLEHLDEDMDGFVSPVDDLSPSKTSSDMRLSNLHSATMQELVEQLQEAREEKRRLRKNLREFEDQFFRQNGRNVQKEDRSPLAEEYSEYKHIKAKLRLLEVLISKRDSSKFI